MKQYMMIFSIIFILVIAFLPYFQIHNSVLLLNKSNVSVSCPNLEDMIVKIKMVVVVIENMVIMMMIRRKRIMMEKEMMMMKT